METSSIHRILRVWTPVNFFTLVKKSCSVKENTFNGVLQHDYGQNSLVKVGKIVQLFIVMIMMIFRSFSEVGRS